MTGGVRAGLLSRETTMKIRVLTLSFQAEGHVAYGVMRESWGDPARSEIPGTFDELHAREPGGLVVARWWLVMPRPGWFAGWQTGAGWAVRGTLRR